MNPSGMQILYVILGSVVAAYLVLINQNLKAIKQSAMDAAKELSEHRLTSAIHESGFERVEGQIARLGDQIANVLNTAKLAHERLDKMQASR